MEDREEFLTKLNEQIKFFQERKLVFSENKVISDILLVYQQARKKIESLDDRLIVSLLGGTNSGKSTTVNAIFEEEITPVSIETHYDKDSSVFYYEKKDIPSLLKEGNFLLRPHQKEEWQHLILIMAVDFDSLENRESEEGQKIFTLSDLVCLITTYESYGVEINFEYLKKAQELEKNCCLIVNKISYLDNESEIEEIRAYLEEKIPEIKKGKIPLFFTDMKNYFLKKEGSGDAERLIAYFKKELLLEKNGLKILEINSVLKNISLQLNYLLKLFSSDEKKLTEIQAVLNELKEEYQERLNNNFFVLNENFKSNLEKKLSEIMDKSWYFKLGVSIKNTWRKLWGQETSQLTKGKLELEIFNMFFPLYQELEEKLKKLIEEEKLPLKFPESDFRILLEDEIPKILKEVIQIFEENASEKLKEIIKSDTVALGIIGGMMSLLASGGLTGWETIISLLAGYGYSKINSQKILKELDDLKDKLVEPLQKRVTAIFFKDWEWVWEKVENLKKQVAVEQDLRAFKGDLEYLREKLDETNEGNRN